MHVLVKHLLLFTLKDYFILFYYQSLCSNKATLAGYLTVGLKTAIAAFNKSPVSQRAQKALSCKQQHLL